MHLTPGRRIGPYEITATVGAGGMGEVFRARDTRLGRDVAIKVLPAAFSQDAERVARFRREAQVLASLHHPNVAAIFGLEESDGTLAIAMELVEGEDLAQRLMRGAVPVDEAIAIAAQIIDGLEAAHEKGIVHRDLKPANIKLRPDGAVKVLDFGLARAYGDTGSQTEPDSSQSPTVARPMTESGVILGTAAYMSPEQARGKPVDKRADIWAFGVVLFEMLAGRKLFASETVSDTLAAVLTREVDWTNLPASTPDRVRRLLERCLDRNPKTRLRDIGDARLDLSARETGRASTPPASRRKRRRTATWIAGASLLALASAIVGIWGWTRLHPPLEPALTRLTIPLPTGQVLTGSGPAISRDGRRIAYVARDAGGISRLYVRQLDRFESALIPASDGAQQPFFSPDGEKIAFYAGGKLMIASLSGGVPIALADASYQPIGGTWGDDDTIVFVPMLTAGLLRIPSSGGKPQRVTEPDDGEKGYAHGWPQFLPGGALLFSVWGGSTTARAGTAALSLESGAWTQVASGTHWSSRYAHSGHLLASRPYGIVGAPFDPRRPHLIRTGTPVIDDVFSVPAVADSWFAVSENGTLAYVPGDPFLGVMAWVDHKGAVVPISSQASAAADITLSPDGTRAVFEDKNNSLWIVDLRLGTRMRLTFDGQGVNVYPIWTRDGKQVVFGSNRDGDWNLYSVPAGGGLAKRILQRKANQMPLSSAPDGTLLFSDRWKGTGSDLLLLAPNGTVTPFLSSPFSKVGGQFSPDGRTIAYVSDETGRDEVYVRSVAQLDDVAAVSTDGGRAPMWSPDGKEIFFRRGDAFLAAGVTTTGSLAVGESRKLFEIRAASGRSTMHPGYSVAPDGTRFLVQLLDPRAVPTQINVILNWFEELKTKVPVR